MFTFSYGLCSKCTDLLNSYVKYTEKQQIRTLYSWRSMCCFAVYMQDLWFMMEVKEGGKPKKGKLMSKSYVELGANYGI